MNTKTETKTISVSDIARSHNVRPAYLRRLLRKNKSFQNHEFHNWFWDVKTDKKLIAIVVTLAKSLVRKPNKKRDEKTSH